jgi:hypothetical protein
MKTISNADAGKLLRVERVLSLTIDRSNVKQCNALREIKLINKKIWKKKK